MSLLSSRTVSAIVILTVCIIFAPQFASAEPVSASQSGAAAGDKQPQMQELTDAMARFRDQDVEGAIQALEAAVKKNPELPPVYMLLAQFYQLANMPAGVREALETGVQKSPDDPEAYVTLARIALAERRITEAELLLTKAGSLLPKLDKNPKRKEALTLALVSGLAQVYQARQDWAKSKQYYEQWVKLEPKNTQAMLMLASVLFQQKDPQAALAKLKELKAADPTAWTPEARLAAFYQQGGDKENAKKWMASALKATPDDLGTQMLAAQLALDNGQLEEAASRASAALRIDPNRLEAKNLRGFIALFQKKYSEAELYFEAAHLKSFGNFAAKNNLALALVEQKDDTKKNRALELARDNIEQYKNSVEAASTYGWVLYKLGRLEDADKALMAAVSSNNYPPDTAYYAAVVANELNRKGQAIQLLKNALKSPNPFSMKPEATALLTELNKL